MDKWKTILMLVTLGVCWSLLRKPSASKDEISVEASGVEDVIDEIITSGDVLSLSKGKLGENQLLVVFDQGCPHCQEFLDELLVLSRHFGKRLNISLVLFPEKGSCDEREDAWACAAAVFGGCRMGPGKLDLNLMKRLQDESAEFLLEQSASCQIPRVKERLAKHRQWVERLMVSATPTVFLNGQKLEGALSAGKLAEWIAKASI